MTGFSFAVLLRKAEHTLGFLFFQGGCASLPEGKSQVFIWEEGGKKVYKTNSCAICQWYSCDGQVPQSLKTFACVNLILKHTPSVWKRAVGTYCSTLQICYWGGAVMHRCLTEALRWCLAFGWPLPNADKWILVASKTAAECLGVCLAKDGLALKRGGETSQSVAAWDSSFGFPFGL